MVPAKSFMKAEHNFLNKLMDFGHHVLVNFDEGRPSMVVLDVRGLWIYELMSVSKGNL